ncbi:MAG: outer membrane beta-barrel protein [Muribaculaceae bacterium]|nr:outer membrane beta-barrel protein [Muribaculaceae bacterium]
MKKYILLAIVAIAAAINIHAEQGDVSLGAEFVYASKHSMAGLGAQVQYEPITNWRFAPEFIYFFKNDGLSALNVNFNVHYIIPTSSSFAIYPLVGFTYGHYKADALVGSVTEDRCGANVGLGAQYRIKDNLHFFTEERFQIMKNFNQSVTVLGLKYTF